MQEEPIYDLGDRRSQKGEGGSLDILAPAMKGCIVKTSTFELHQETKWQQVTPTESNCFVPMIQTPKVWRLH